jgi:hypothetical protein
MLCSYNLKEQWKELPYIVCSSSDMRVKLILVLEIAPYEVSCYFLSNIDEN